MFIETPKLLEKILDYSVLKQKVISKNIANAGALNYKRENVRFEDVLSENIDFNLRVTNTQHIKKSKLEILPQSEINELTYSDSENISGFNNVDIDREMAEMAQNTILFKFAAMQLNGYFKSLQDVIKGGR